MKVYTNLSKNERDFICIHLIQGKNQSWIAKSLGRYPSIIKREIDRNSVYLGKGRGNNKKYYLPDEAQQKYFTGYLKLYSACLFSSASIAGYTSGSVFCSISFLQKI